MILDQFGVQIEERREPAPRNGAGCPGCFKVADRTTVTGFGGTWKTLCAECGYKYEGGAGCRAED